ncbi:MAG: hypothetical protein IPP47_19045 [Bryobacterales bacterium]|nr:hypothetical protein [Bryobacterales bacterium]
MHKHLLLIAFALLSTPAAWANVVLTLDPVTISGTPGQAAGWGFTLTPDTVYYISVSSALVDTETNPGLGFFSDWISLAGGPNSGVLPPGGAAWIQAYDPQAGTGFGEYFIDPGAAPGDGNGGLFLLIFSRYSADPNGCGSCFIDTQMINAQFGVNVTSAGPTLVPEPAWTGAFAAVALLAAARLRRRARGLDRPC